MNNSSSDDPNFADQGSMSIVFDPNLINSKTTYEINSVCQNPNQRVRTCAFGQFDDGAATNQFIGSTGNFRVTRINVKGNRVIFKGKFNLSDGFAKGIFRVKESIEDEASI